MCHNAAMATIRKTTYRCDGCGAVVEKKRDLRAFAVLYGGTTYRYGRTERPGIKTELCDDCEAKFASALCPFFGEEGALSIRRDAPE